MIKSKPYFSLALIVFIIEVLIATVLKNTILRPVFGDFLVVILIFCFVKAFTNWDSKKVAIGVLLFAFTIEFGQYIDILDLLSIEKNTLTALIFGASFDWLDLLAYAFGVIAALWLDRFIRSGS